jgi:hypothetical protein
MNMYLTPFIETSSIFTQFGGRGKVVVVMVVVGGNNHTT